MGELGSSVRQLVDFCFYINKLCCRPQTSTVTHTHTHWDTQFVSRTSLRLMEEPENPCSLFVHHQRSINVHKFLVTICHKYLRHSLMCFSFSFLLLLLLVFPRMFDVLSLSPGYPSCSHVTSDKKYFLFCRTGLLIVRFPLSSPRSVRCSGLACTCTVYSLCLVVKLCLCLYCWERGKKKIQFSNGQVIEIKA